MKAKETKVQRYTATQIKMLVDRMVQEGQDRVKEARETRTKEYVVKRDAAISAHFKAHGYTAEQANMLRDALNLGYGFGDPSEKPLLKLLNVPKPPKDVAYHAVRDLGEEFRFKLTMMPATDYEKHMAEFAAAIDKLLK